MHPVDLKFAPGAADHVLRASPLNRWQVRAALGVRQSGRRAQGDQCIGQICKMRLAGHCERSGTLRDAQGA
jgi:hypothetical protein